MSNQRIVNFAFFVVAILAFWVSSQLLTQIWAQFQLPDHLIVGQFGFPWAIALLLTATALVILLRHERATPFLNEVVAELKEVTWPTRQEVYSHTKVVIATVIVVALILGAFDFVWAKVSKLLLNPNI